MKTKKEFVPYSLVSKKVPYMLRYMYNYTVSPVRVSVCSIGYRETGADVEVGARHGPATTRSRSLRERERYCNVSNSKRGVTVWGMVAAVGEER